MEGPRHQLGQACGVVHLHHPLGHAAEHRAVVQLLKSLAPQRAARDLAHKEQQRRGILVRNVHARRRVGGPRPARHKAHAGLPGELALRLGHHRRAAFLAAHGDGDGRVVQGIQHRQKAFAGHAKKLLHAVHQKLIDKDLAAAAGREVGHGVT